MNGWIYSLMDRNHLEEAIGLIKAYDEACPNYEKLSQRELAIVYYNKTLALDSDFAQAQSKLNALEANAPPAK